MPRKSSKENKNPYFLRREALCLTREAASERTVCLPPEKIERIENERLIPRPEEVLELADAYGSPELCNYYCSHQCEIGKRYVPEIRMKDLSGIVLEMLASLNAAYKCRDRLVEITVDGKIGNDELDDFIRIQENLEKISVTVETLQLWSEQMVAGGRIDREEYEKRTKKE